MTAERKAYLVAKNREERNAANRTYYALHRDRLLAAKRAERGRDLLRIRARDRISKRAWRLANPDRVQGHREAVKRSGYARAWRQRNPEKSAAASRKYRQVHAERVRQARAHYKEPAGRANARSSRWKSQNPEKVQLHLQARRRRKVLRAVHRVIEVFTKKEAA